MVFRRLGDHDFFLVRVVCFWFGCAENEKAVMGVTAPPITLVAMKIFQPFYP